LSEDQAGKKHEFCVRLFTHLCFLEKLIKAFAKSDTFWATFVLEFSSRGSIHDLYLVSNRFKHRRIRAEVSKRKEKGAGSITTSAAQPEV